MEGEKQKMGKSKTGSKYEKGEVIEDIDGGEEGHGKEGERGKSNKEVANSGITAFRDVQSGFQE